MALYRNPDVQLCMQFVGWHESREGKEMLAWTIYYADKNMTQQDESVLTQVFEGKAPMLVSAVVACVCVCVRTCEHADAHVCVRECLCLRVRAKQLAGACGIERCASSFVYQCFLALRRVTCSSLLI